MVGIENVLQRLNLEKKGDSEISEKPDSIAVCGLNAPFSCKSSKTNPKVLLEPQRQAVPGSANETGFFNRRQCHQGDFRQGGLIKQHLQGQPAGFFAGAPTRDRGG